MIAILDNKIEKDIEQAILFCSQEGIEIDFVYTMPEAILAEISTRTLEHPSMYFASVDMLKYRLKNGAYLLKKEAVVYGHIFVHEHKVYKFSVFERASLWIHPKYSNQNLGLLLMNLLTQKFTKSFLISIAQEPRVHHNNELLGMKRIMLTDLNAVLIETLEKLGKLRDEKYKYYVNPYFESKIKQFNKILINQKKED